MTQRNDYYKPGDYNAICDGCGAKFKASELAKDWKGFFKCTKCWEPRHPQDFVRAYPGAEPSPVPFVRPPPEPVYEGVCSVSGQCSLPDAATADCWLAEYVSPSFDPNAS